MAVSPETFFHLAISYQRDPKGQFSFHAPRKSPHNSINFICQTHLVKTTSFKNSPPTLIVTRRDEKKKGGRGNLNVLKIKDKITIRNQVI